MASNNNGRELLKSLRNSEGIDFISKVTRDQSKLLQLDLKSAKLYSHMIKDDSLYQKEFEKPIIY